jgi:tetratricopeptide (TPR) repeat protein
MKFYNRYISTIMLVAAVATLPACNKKLDVVPGKEIVPEQILTASDVQAVLMGAYSNLQDPNAFGERMVLVPDFLADEGEMHFAGSFRNYPQYESKRQDASSDIAENMWKRGFATINNVNLVLSKISLVPEADRPALIAEARFIRGMMYFSLSNFYGKPYSAGNITSNLTVPLVLDAVIGTSDLSRGTQPRATVEAVHKQIIADLQDAAANLPESNGGAGRANKYAAYAYLSRVYLAEGKYPEAVAVADSIIQSGAYTLNNTFDKAFNSVINTSEDIFAIQQTNQSNAGTSNYGLQTLYGGRGYSGRGDIVINIDQLPAYENGDVRKGFFYEDRGTSVGASMYTTKWQRAYKVIPLVRYAEILLTRAEANLRAGTAVGDDPLKDINAVRVRSKASELAAVTADEVAEERIRELLFEGEKLWTYKRLKRNVGARTYLDNKLTLPVPQRELDVNKQLTQNEGY